MTLYLVSHLLTSTSTCSAGPSRAV